MDFYNIPIFIISYNRLSDIKKCVTKLSQDGYRNLIIVDNASTDEELLKYLHTLEYKVHFLKKNWGPYVIWQCHLFDDILLNQFYVVTDPDIIPVENCPTDYVEYFYEVLQEFPDKTKVGFSLKLDDIPDGYRYKYDIWRFESFYWEKCVKTNRGIAYEASIDTTFALYRPRTFDGTTDDFYNGIRTGGVYQARHLGWYVENQELTKSNNLYYKNESKGNTSHNENAIINFRYYVILRLITNHSLNFYDVVKFISNKDTLKPISIFSLTKLLFIIFLKRIKYYFIK